MSTTSLSVRFFHFRHETNRVKERAVMAVAWKLPRQLAYWAAIRVLAHATTGRYSDQIVPELRALDALERWKR
jgi:hypothetical protein